MNFYLKKILLAILLLCPVTPALSYTIICDIGFTLFWINYLKVGMHIGVMDALRYVMVNGKSTSDLTDAAFKILTLAGGTQEGRPEDLIKDPEGRVLPLLMCEWFAGTKTSKDIRKRALICIKDLSKSGYFADECEERLLTNVIHTMFDPNILNNATSPLRGASHFLKKCSHVTDSNGKPRHTLVMLSNISIDQFEPMFASMKNQERIFKYFKLENIFVSAYLNLLKPHRDIYEYVFKTGNFDPKDCIFIDDDPQNIKGAQACGIPAKQTILVKNGNFRKVTHQLKKLGVFDKCTSLDLEKTCN